ncbi:hypothetical protein B0H13DRAFT_2446285 [Mycena leptocephala]|nr:hypothetical protein B0H13DRAFT_2446285 [Mycena leptocephala]
MTVNTYGMLAGSFKTPFSEAICNTTESLLKCIQTVKQNKDDCSCLMEQAHELLNAIIVAHVKSDTGVEFPPKYSACLLFDLALHKIYTFVEAQQKGSKVKKFFRQGEMSNLLKECKAELQKGLEFFQGDAEKRHKEVIVMIEALSDTTSSDGLSIMSTVYSDSHTSSNSISMLLSEPKIFHGRQSELSDIPRLFSQGTPRVAILGAGGMGKTSLARAIIHHAEIAGRYNQHRFFIACDSATTQVELSAIIGAHLGLKPGKDLTCPVIQHFSDNPHGLLILDNLETLWEPSKSRGSIEEFLSLLTGVNDLALVITMRGAERPAKVAWTRPFLPPLKPLEQDAARQTFIDIADNIHDPEDVNKSKILLSLLSMLPDGLSDIELVQSKLPIDNIMACKAALIRTTLAYSNEKKTTEIIEYRGTLSSSGAVARVSSNYSNMQSILQNGLQPGHPDLVDSIYCTCYLNHFSLLIGQGAIPLIGQIASLIPHPRDHRLEVYFIIELFNSWVYYPILDPETLLSEALKHLKHFDDSNLKCKFYNSVTTYYRNNHDITTAKKLCETGISLALSTGNTKFHSQGLTTLGWIKRYLGDYPEAQAHAYEAQNLAKTCADLYTEAEALLLEAICWYTMGNYKQGISLSNQAKHPLHLCGMSGGYLYHNIMNNQAEIHKLKSEYVEARSIHISILQAASVDHDPYFHAVTLLNIAEIDVSIGAPQEDVQRSCNIARDIFETQGYSPGVMICDTTVAELYLREGNMLAAKTLLESCWGTPGLMSSWTTIFLMHSLKHKEKLGIHEALQFLGDLFLAQDDRHTAISLFIVALEGFTYMDVHRGKAECLLRLGDISKGQGNLLKAVELWETARPLFERSSQTEQVGRVDERLAGVSEEVLGQHRTNLTCLAGLNAPSGPLEHMNNSSEIQELEGLDVHGEKEHDLVAV